MRCGHPWAEKCVKSWFPWLDQLHRPCPPCRKTHLKTRRSGRSCRRKSHVPRRRAIEIFPGATGTTHYATQRLCPSIPPPPIGSATDRLIYGWDISEGTNLAGSASVHMHPLISTEESTQGTVYNQQLWKYAPVRGRSSKCFGMHHYAEPGWAARGGPKA